MPAYRSSAEADIRAPVVAHLRLMVPGCRIIHEINAASFGNRIDVLAVGDARMVAVEIKSAKDKLDRLPDQVKAMKTVTREVFAAIHEKFLHVQHSLVYPPDEARGSLVWVYPRTRRVGHVDCSEEWRIKDRWQKSMVCLPPGAINMLWREELHNILRVIGESRFSKLDMGESIDRIRWRMTGEQTTKAICAALRARDCKEADPPIYENDKNAAVCQAA